MRSHRFSRIIAILAATLLVVTGLFGAHVAIEHLAHDHGNAPQPRTEVAGVTTERSAIDFGSLGVQPLAPVIAMTPTRTARGYWLLSADGGVFTFGDAKFAGTTFGLGLQAPVVDIVAGKRGYWLISTDGGVFSFGGAKFYGSMGGTQLNAPIVAAFATPSGEGYVMVSSDGGVFTFGDAEFHGSLGGIALTGPIVDAQPTAGNGYWMASTDGGVFTFGDAPFNGSLGAIRLNQPIAAFSASPDGYRMFSRDGGVFTFNAPFLGSLGGTQLDAPITGSGTTATGYWMTDARGRVFPFAPSESRSSGSGSGSGSGTPTTPSRPGTPNPSAGPSDRSTLRRVGPLTVRQDGAVVENVDVAGEVRIAANNVTVRNFRANNVYKEPAKVGLTLMDGEIHGEQNNTADGVVWSDYTAIRIEVHNVFDAFKAMGNVVIESCYVHDLNFFTGSDAGAGGYSHNDGVQISSGSNVVIRKSRIIPTEGNSAIFIDSDQGPIDSVTVTQNILGGGGFTLYSIGSRSAPQFGRPTNVSITDNVFTETHLFDYATIAATGTRFARNVNWSGQPVTARVDPLS
ncbi:MAG: hypothetical protein ACOYNI_05235 [Acidimicrobiia bacterium]